MDDRLDPPLHPPRTLWPRSAALASTLPALVACSDRQVDTGFRITNVAFDNDSTITLTFSQSVGELGTVDPNDFRLSMAQSIHATYTYGGVTETYDYTSYRDLAGVIYNYNSYGAQFTFMMIEPGAAANQIVLRTASPLGPTACTWLEYVREEYEMFSSYPGITAIFEFEMFLHYAAGDVPIESESGEPLADIGRDWVLDDEDYYEREGFGFTRLSPQLRIPCP
jgi:hypothetical protein